MVSSEVAATMQVADDQTTSELSDAPINEISNDELGVAGAIDTGEHVEGSQKPDASKAASATKAKGTTKASKDRVEAKGAKTSKKVATPKKRNAAGENEDASPTKKTRGTAQAKKSNDGVKAEFTATEDGKATVPSQYPSSKKGRTAASAKKGKVTTTTGNKTDPSSQDPAITVHTSDEKATQETSQEPAMDNKPIPPKRASNPKGKAEGRELSTTMEGASAADKMLIHWKEVEKKTWAEIRESWKVMTGQETADSTLPNRYNRLKTNFMILKDEDRERLLAAKNEIEKEHHATFWAKVQNLMELKGSTEKYPSAFLAKEFAKLSAAEGVKKGGKAVVKDEEMQDVTAGAEES